MQVQSEVGFCSSSAPRVANEPLPEKNIRSRYALAERGTRPRTARSEVAGRQTAKPLSPRASRSGPAYVN
jgi:hypothetical protein